MLELVGSRPAWQAAARDGRLVLGGGERAPVVALLGPESNAPDGLSRARRAAGTALGLRHAGVVRLLQVVQHDQRVAWCYEPQEALGVVHLVGPDGAVELSARAAAEVVAQVAEILLGLGPPGLHHPGPEPQDLLIGDDGRVRILGFAGPYPASPAMRPPEPDQVEPATVYRLGVLLAILLSGTPPATAPDPNAHAVLVRRSMIRAMARPGPVLSERYGQWFRGMLAWAPAERPPLSAVPSGLRAVAWATGGEGLQDWAARRVPELLADMRDDPSIAPPMLDVGPEDSQDPDGLGTVGGRPGITPVDPTAATPVRSAGRPRSLSPTSGRRHDADDPTQEATFDPDEPEGRTGQRNLPPRGRLDSIPVDVGPPPEVVARLPRLPKGFLQGDERSTTGPRTGPTEPEVEARTPGQTAVLVGLTVGLTLLGSLLSVYLLYGAGPNLADGGPALGIGLGVPRDQGPAPAPQIDVPAPDLHGDSDTDPETDTETPLTPDSVSPPDRTPRSPSPPPRSPGGAGAGEAGFSVMFRLPPGQDGRVQVACARGRQGAAANAVRLFGLTAGEECVVRARSPAGEPVSDVIVVQGPATVDCFHAWASECLE